MKTIPMLPAAALLATLLAVSACGGGDANEAEAAAAPPADVTPPVPSAVQGRWTGATASGRAKATGRSGDRSRTRSRGL